MVIAQVFGMAASVGYYVASQATQIFAGRMDLVGCIGTRLMLFDFHVLFENEGIEAVPIDTGEFKSAGALCTEITESQRADFQRIIDAFGEDFVNVIARGRPLSKSQVKKLADGRIFTAAEALDNELIDKIQTFDKTIADIGARSARRMRSRRARAELAVAGIHAQ